MQQNKRSLPISKSAGGGGAVVVDWGWSAASADQVWGLRPWGTLGREERERGREREREVIYREAPEITV